MRVQSFQNNNYNTNFGSLIIDGSMRQMLEQLPVSRLQEIREIGERLQNTKYYDLKVYRRDNYYNDYIQSAFIPKTEKAKKLTWPVEYYCANLLEGPNGYKTKVDWRYSKEGCSGSIAVLDFESSTDARRAKTIIDISNYNVANKGIQNLIPAIRAWADICTEVLEKSMDFIESGKKTVLTETENIIEGLISMPKYETRNILWKYIKDNDFGNLYTAEDMLELLRDMGEEELLSRKDILTTPIKEGDSSILMYIADIMPTADNAKEYDKILKILSKVQGINYNYKDKNGVSFLEKVMMSENFKLLDLVKNEKLEYYPELDYVYENIQNPNFKDKVKELTIILKNTDGLTANDIKSELQGIAFQNTVRGK